MSEPPPQPKPSPTPTWVKGFAIVLALLAIGFILLHLTGHGMGAHMHVRP